MIKKLKISTLPFIKNKNFFNKTQHFNQNSEIFVSKLTNPLNLGKKKFGSRRLRFRLKYWFYWRKHKLRHYTYLRRYRYRFFKLTTNSKFFRSIFLRNFKKISYFSQKKIKTYNLYKYMPRTNFINSLTNYNLTANQRYSSNTNYTNFLENTLPNIFFKKKASLKVNNLNESSTLISYTITYKVLKTTKLLSLRIDYIGLNSLQNFFFYKFLNLILASKYL